MTDEVAKLGIGVESKSLKDGTQDLKDFKKAADDAAKSADNLNQSGKTGAAGVGKLGEEAAKQKTAMEGAAEAAAGLTARQLGLVAIGGTLVATTAAIGAAAAVIAYQWTDAQQKIERSLIGIGRTTGTTVEDINKFSYANATATGLSVGQARDAAIEFAKLGKVAVGDINGLGDAIHGFSILTGQDAAQSTKTLAGLLSGDLVKAAQELNGVYGSLDGRTIQLVSSLQDVGDRAGAINLIFSTLSQQNREAAGSVDILTKAWNALGNALSYVKNAVPASLAGGGDKEILESLQRQREQLAAGGIVDPALNDAIDALQKKLNSLDSKTAQSQLAQLSAVGDNVVRSIFPQIDAIGKLNTAYEQLSMAATSTAGQGLGGLNQEALQAISFQIAAQRESLERSIQQVAVVKQLQQAYGGVSQQTALALNHLEGQLDVAKQVTASAKVEAQTRATIADLMANAGKSEPEAILIADKQRVVLLENIYQSMQRAVRASQDQLDLTRAQGTADEARLKSEIAYRDARIAGATAGQAATISANTLATETLRAAQAAQTLADQWDAAEKSAMRAAKAFGGNYDQFGGFDVPKGTQYTSTFRIGHDTPSVEEQANAALMTGGLDAAIRAAKSPQRSIGDFTNPKIAPDVNLVRQLYELKNAQTSDKTLQAANLREEIGWLLTQPETIARDQSIVQLNESIKSLTGSVDTNTNALTQVTSPSTRTAWADPLLHTQLMSGGDTRYEQYFYQNPVLPPTASTSSAPTSTPTVVIQVEKGVTSDDFIASRAQIARALT